MVDVRNQEEVSLYPICEDNFFSPKIHIELKKQIRPHKKVRRIETRRS
jgi:hypothetical protein